jgi:hypothetical protein
MQFEYIGLFRLRNPALDTIVRSHEIVHLVPSRGTCSGKIKASGAVLFDRSRLRKKRVKFSIMTKDDPAFGRYFADPFVIRSRLIEVEFIFGVVVIFN